VPRQRTLGPTQHDPRRRASSPFQLPGYIEPERWPQCKHRLAYSRRAPLVLKQAKISATRGIVGTLRRLRIFSFALLAKRVCSSGLSYEHGRLSFLQGCSYCLWGSEHPASDFMPLPQHCKTFIKRKKIGWYGFQASKR
jgi:hypothetical protein